MNVVFSCKICGASHASITDEKGMEMLPKSITTSRNADKSWYFHCTQSCKEIVCQHVIDT